MTSRVKKYLFFLCLCSLIVFSVGLHSSSSVQDEDVAKIFKQSCSTTGCHSGRFPPMNLNLEQDKFMSSLMNAASQQLKHLRLVDTEKPEKSYLLMKIKGNEAIDGNQMPLNSSPLEEADIKTIERWIYSLKETRAIEKEPSVQNDKRKFTKPAFWGTRLINLPTDQSIGKRKVLFRISHRYFPAVKDGYEAFYGIDGPAVILLSLGYGISDRFSLSLARSNRFKEVELSLKWLILEQGETKTLPFSAALRIGGSLLTQTEPGEKTFRSENMTFNSQLILSYQLSNSFSLLVVPAYSSNTNHWEEASEGTVSIGIGTRYMILNDFSVMAEWVPVIAGYKVNSSGWGIGFEKRIGGHVFQIFITNSIGMTSSQFIPGGELKLQDGEFRLGFNIFRWF